MDTLRTLTRVVAIRGRRAVELRLPVEGQAQPAVRLACEVARHHGLQAENLILMVKASWRSLAEDRGWERPEFNEALDQLISMCIAEFYRDREGSLQASVIARDDDRGGRGPALARRRDASESDGRR